MTIINWRIRRARIQQMDFMLEMSDYYHNLLNCSIHQIAPIGTWKEKRDLHQKVSTPCVDFSLSLFILFHWRLRKMRDQENGRKKSSTMIIASHLMCDARMTKEKNSNILSIYPFPFFLSFIQVNTLIFIGAECTLVSFIWNFKTML